MPKISSLPPAGSLADDDETPFVDDSTATTKKFTLAGLKAWLQSLTAWVSKSNIDFDSGIWWEELGRTSNSGQASISVASLTSKKYLRLIISCNPSTSMNLNLRFNNDSGATQYTWRLGVNGAAHTTDNADPQIQLATGTAGTDRLMTFDIINVATSQKNLLGMQVATATPAALWENAGSWLNTTDAINRIDLLASTGNLGSAQMIVLGHD